MRVIVIIKANEESEAAKMPSEELFREMGQFNEELVKAGIMLAAEGLTPSARGKRKNEERRRRTHPWSARLGAFGVLGHRAAQLRAARARHAARLALIIARCV